MAFSVPHIFILIIMFPTKLFLLMKRELFNMIFPLIFYSWNESWKTNSWIYSTKTFDFKYILFYLHKKKTFSILDISLITFDSQYLICWPKWNNTPIIARRRSHQMLTFWYWETWENKNSKSRILVLILASITDFNHDSSSALKLNLNIPPYPEEDEENDQHELNQENFMNMGALFFYYSYLFILLQIFLII